MPKRYSPKLKFQVVLELLKGDKTPNQVARAYGVHPNSAGLWKRTFLGKGPEIFAIDGAVADYERRIAELEQLKQEGNSLFLDARDMEELRVLVFRQMKYYNTNRRHSSLGYVSPMTYIESVLQAGKEQS